MGIRAHCLALGGVDLTSSAGKMAAGALNRQVFDLLLYNTCTIIFHYLGIGHIWNCSAAYGE